MRYIVGAVVGLIVAAAQVAMWLIGGALRVLWYVVSTLGTLAWAGAAHICRRRKAVRRFSVQEISIAADAEWEKHATV